MHWLLKFYYNSWNQEVLALQLNFFKSCFVYFSFPSDFYNITSFYHKKPPGILLRENWHLTHIEASDQWTQCIFPFFMSLISSNILQISMYRSFTSFVSFIPTCFIFFGDIVNAILKVLISKWLMVVYRNETDFVYWFGILQLVKPTY